MPIGVAAVIAITASGVLSAQAAPDLPARTAAQLLADVERADVAGLSGTIVDKTSLGLPAIPGASSTGLIGLLSGSHTARVWYAGPNKQRFALVDTLGETDVFHNGTDVWTYESAKHEATHAVLPPQAMSHDRERPQVAPTLTPEQAAQAALAAIDPTTVITTDSARRVAGRSAYELVLAPRDGSSRVSSVRIAIDGATKIPLGVQVYARGSASPAIDVSFTRIRFAVPDSDSFVFKPADNVTVKQGSLASFSANMHGSSQPTITRIGTGWTTVFKVTSPDVVKNLGRQGNALVTSLPHVSWTGGGARVFESKLFTALICDDNRLYIGAVDPNVLVSAAEHRK